MNQLESKDINIIGFPFTKIGRGVVSLNIFRALKAAGFPPRVCDLSSKKIIRDKEIENELSSFLIHAPDGKINIFVINGDQIESTQELIGKYPQDSYNIIYPAWELSDYPDEWLEKFKFFNEVWVPSKFMKSSLDRKLQIPINLVHHPINTKVPYYQNRRYFGIKDNAYAFLFLFDFRSYIERKNPFGMINAFEQLCLMNLYQDIQAVIKVSGGDRYSKAGNDYLKFLNQIKGSHIKERILLIDKELTEIEIRNLIRCTDCFVSLHRSEGFGLGLAEAMSLGKPVIGTGYSGNLEFMNDENSFLVDFELVPVKQDEYPFSENQFWAEPNLDQAIDYMDNLVKNPDLGIKTGEISRLHIQKAFSYLSVGLQMKSRLSQIVLKTTN